MRKSRIAFAAVLACSWATTAASQQVAGYYGGRITDGSTTPGTIVEFPNGNNINTFSQSAPFAASASGSTNVSSGSVSVSADTANSNVALHGSASASIGGEAPFLSPGSADSEFDLYAYDTFYVGGPAGAAEQFQYALTLNGSVQTIIDPPSRNSIDAYGALQLFADSNWTEPGTVTPFTTCVDGHEFNLNPCSLLASVYLNQGFPNGGTLTGTLTLIGGTTIQLGELLWGRASADNHISETAIMNASNTGFFTLTPITAGASFTTASGLSYAQSPEAVGSVPEPATWALMLLGFGAIGAAARRTRSAPRREPNRGENLA